MILMATESIIIANSISRINIKDIIVDNKKSNKKASIAYHDTSLIFQTPYLEVQDKVKTTNLSNIYQIDTLFKGDSKEKIIRWYNFIENLETHISTQVMNVGVSWFSQKDVSFKSLIREIEGTEDYFIKWTFDDRDILAVDEKNKPYDLQNIKNMDKIKLIIEVSNLWINENQFGIIYMIRKMMINPYIEKICSTYVFGGSDSETDENEPQEDIISLLATEQKPIVATKNKKSKHNMVDIANDKLLQVAKKNDAQKVPTDLPNDKHVIKDTKIKNNTKRESLKQTKNKNSKNKKNIPIVFSDKDSSDGTTSEDIDFV